MQRFQRSYSLEGNVLAVMRICGTATTTDVDDIIWNTMHEKNFSGTIANI